MGTTVTWTNDGVNLHTATSYDGEFETGSLATGASASYTFTKPGTYNYFCRQHLRNGMYGTIVVQ